ncbi:uncharacterized protein BDCG_06253 [Blastomyces dermatitidis ER-3]|uniref:Uncharacterized protein n=1 Tax=Ajellomyces dermatitidis (strain ER-3 / ATCC MYA-2586) TaxID=559297 RepID=A0ABP2F2S1_AJEDR|nr:uncharacterized protein BDCG_06253 [Blastomyces dermatitidis ER-3]EEQ91133.1 hypothetical protein BDCG_06253 [Blastomyces dermatitidis ER-3]
MIDFEALRKHQSRLLVRQLGGVVMLGLKKGAKDKVAEHLHSGMGYLRHPWPLANLTDQFTTNLRSCPVTLPDVRAICFPDFSPTTSVGIYSDLKITAPSDSPMKGFSSAYPVNMYVKERMDSPPKTHA